MSMESLNRTSDVVQTPSEIGDTPIRVNVDVLKQRIIDQKKKDKFKRSKNRYCWNGLCWLAIDN